MAFPGLAPGAPGCAYRKTGRRPLLFGWPSFFLGRQPAVRILLELDGAVVDVQPAYWLAYQKTVADLGLARIDQATFWRLLRSGVPEGQILRGSKPRHWKQYRERFAELLESADCVALLRLQPHARDVLASLNRRNHVISIVAQSNLSARCGVMASSGLHFPPDRLTQLPGSLEDRARQLHQLARGDYHTLFVAADDKLVRAGFEAGLTCLGVASGPCTEARLTQAGATRVFHDLKTFADALLHAAGEQHPFAAR